MPNEHYIIICLLVCHIQKTVISQQNEVIRWQYTCNKQDNPQIKQALAKLYQQRLIFKIKK